MSPTRPLPRSAGVRHLSRPLVARATSLMAATALVLSACTTDRLVAPPRSPDPTGSEVPPGEKLAVVHWNQFTQSLTSMRPISQHAAWRVMTYVTLAQHAAVEQAAAHPEVTRAMIRGAVAGASAPVLRYGFPLDTAGIDAVLRNEEAALPPAEQDDFRVGEGIGRATATQVIARARNDNFTAVWTGSIPTGPGKWTSLSNPPAPPAFPLGGEIKTLFLTSGRQFRPAPPPAFGSGAFRDDLAEVRRIADSRTPVQDSLAKFWAMATGTMVVGYWNTMALQLLTADRLGERDAAHLLALLNAAGWDALTACHDAKYTYWVARPSGADPAIVTAIGVPNHPAFPSNHACLSGTSAQILGAIFPAQRAAMMAQANEAAISRLYAGIHYRFDAEAGLEIARKVSAHALELDRKGWLRYLVRP
jgi:hypothetical protein